MHASWATPLWAATRGTNSVERDGIQAAYWANTNAGMSLASYLQTAEGRPYARFWNLTEVQRADALAAANP